MRDWKPRWTPKGKPLDVDEQAPLDDITDEDIRRAREHWEHMDPKQKEEIRRIMREVQMSIYGRVIDDDPTHLVSDSNQ